MNEKLELEGGLYKSHNCMAMELMATKRFQSRDSKLIFQSLAAQLTRHFNMIFPLFPPLPTNFMSQLVRREAL